MIDSNETVALDADTMRVGVLCNEFGRGLKSGESPRIEVYLNLVEETLQPQALRDLLKLEVEFRRGRGELVRLDDYLARFPSLKVVVTDVLLATVQQAQETLPKNGQLQNHQQQSAGSSSSQLKVQCPSCHMPINVAVDTALTEILCPSCGFRFPLVDQRRETRMATALSKVGRFELIERLGVGGFGSVWKARDKELDRTVAVKIPRAGGMSVQEQENFFREARAAAQLCHPNIVSVHEVGRDGENIYIVSDFVRGITLHDWLSGQLLTSREAAELCAKIADALHYANEQGIVHRDLKPSNIMIDGDGQPHLMDFGLARRDVGEVTVTTDGQIMGTPGYMSPEQARGFAHSADRRSDVYSLGVVLFELLTHELPFRGNARMVMHQVIHNEPRAPRSLNDQIPRDLDTICIKCLQKEPAKRYQSAGECAADIRRFLARQPIQARPVSSAERCWRWCRRNPVVAFLAVTVTTLLILVILVTSWWYLDTASSLAQTASALAQADANLALADTNYDIALKAVNKSLTVVGDDKLVNVPQMEEARSDLLREALVAYQGLLDKKPTDIRARSQVADAYYRVANIHRELAEQPQAAAAYEHAIELLNALATEFPDQTDFRNQIGMAYDYLGETLRDMQKVAEAKDAYHKALGIQLNLLKVAPDNPKYQEELSRTRNNFGILLAESNRPKDAEESLTNAIQILADLSKLDTKNVAYQQELARSNINLGNVYAKTDRVSEAEQAYRRAIELLEDIVKNHPDTHHYQYTLAVSLVNFSNVADEKLKKPADAEQLINKAINLLSSLRKDYPRIPLYRKELANAYNSLANQFAHAKNYSAAKEKGENARDLFEELLAEYPDNADYQSLAGMTYGTLAWLADVQKDQAAMQLAGEAIKHQQVAFALNPKHPDYKKRLDGHKEFLTNVKAKLQGTDNPKK